MVKLEVRDAAAVCVVVKSVVVVGARRCGAQLAIAAGGRGVPRGLALIRGGAPVGRTGAGGTAVGGVVCFG